MNYPYPLSGISETWLRLLLWQADTAVRPAPGPHPAPRGSSARQTGTILHLHAVPIRVGQSPDYVITMLKPSRERSLSKAVSIRYLTRAIVVSRASRVR